MTPEEIIREAEDLYKKGKVLEDFLTLVYLIMEKPEPVLKRLEKEYWYSLTVSFSGDTPDSYYEGAKETEEPGWDFIKKYQDFFKEALRKLGFRDITDEAFKSSNDFIFYLESKAPPEDEIGKAQIELWQSLRKKDYKKFCRLFLSLIDENIRLPGEIFRTESDSPADKELSREIEKYVLEDIRNLKPTFFVKNVISNSPKNYGFVSFLAENKLLSKFLNNFYLFTKGLDDFSINHLLTTFLRVFHSEYVNEKVRELIVPFYQKIEGLYRKEGKDFMELASVSETTTLLSAYELRKGVPVVKVDEGFLFLEETEKRNKKTYFMVKDALERQRKRHVPKSKVKELKKLKTLLL